MANSSEEERAQLIEHMLEKLIEEKEALQAKIHLHIKHVEDKTRSWLKTPSPSFQHVQGLIGAAMESILNKSNCFLATAVETSDSDILKMTQHEQNSKTTISADVVSNILDRLVKLEQYMSTHEKLKQTILDQTLEVTRCREDAQANQRELEKGIEKVAKKQIQTFEIQSQQTSEQDSNIKNMSEEIQILKDKESKTNKSLQQLSRDMTQLYIEIHNHKDKLDNTTQNINSYSDLISAMQENYGVFCQLLHQRLMPIDKLMQTFNRNLCTSERDRKQVLATQDNGSNLSNGALPSLNPPATKSKVDFVASGGHRTPYGEVIVFNEVEGNEGNYFNPSTGWFTAPVKGTYMVNIAITSLCKKRVDADVYRMYNQSRKECLGKVYSLEDLQGGSKTFVVYMDAGDQIFAVTEHFMINCWHFSCSLQ